MSTVVRIKGPLGRTEGWQARVHVAAERYLSKYFAARAHGGSRAAKALATEELARLERRARRIKREAA